MSSSVTTIEKPEAAFQPLISSRSQVGHDVPHLPGGLLKRSMDIFAVAAFFPLLVLIFIVIAALMKLTSRGPLFYGHLRMGQGGRPFTAWKFRTMVEDADGILQHHLTANAQWAREWVRNHKLRNDPRVTPLGRLLRRFSLDELPQVLNVLKGEMSLVGPRPIGVQEIGRYGADYALYCRVKPGITGLWQISGRNNTTYEERVAFDKYYVCNWSVGFDLRILKQTVRAVLGGDGAY